MPKLKTKKAIEKRFKANGAGALSHGHACMRHNLRRRQQSTKRQSRRPLPASPCNAKMIKRCAPYGL